MKEEDCSIVRNITLRGAFRSIQEPKSIRRTIRKMVGTGEELSIGNALSEDFYHRRRFSVYQGWLMDGFISVFEHYTSKTLNLI